MNAKTTRTSTFESSYDVETGTAVIVAKGDADVNVELQAESIEGRSKYSIIGELRYYAGEVRNAANKAVKDGKSAADALTVAMSEVWSKMQNGSYVLRLGAGESVDSVTPQARFDAIVNHLLPVKYQGDMLPKAIAAITAKFNATVVSEGSRKGKDGVEVPFTRTRRPAFDKFCSVQETKDFLDKHFAKDAVSMDDELFSEDVA